MTDADLFDWDVNRTLHEIRTLMPIGWTYKFQPVERVYWSFEFSDTQGVVLWQDHNPAANIILFNAYGWLREKVAPIPKPRAGSNWIRRRELTLQAVNAEALRQSRTPDPADVDPAEVAAVYESHRHKPRR